MNKITVKDIVDRCDVNRNTFYYHFQDIPSLLREMMETQVDGIIREHCALGRPMDCIEPALEYGPGPPAGGAPRVSGRAPGAV